MNSSVVLTVVSSFDLRDTFSRIASFKTSAGRKRAQTHSILGVYSPSIDS